MATSIATSMATIRTNVIRLLTRREYQVGDISEDTIEAITATGERVSVYFIKNKKVNNNLIKSILSTEPQSRRVILIHNMSITPDAKHIITLNNNMYGGTLPEKCEYTAVYFETFTFSEMMYDVVGLTHPHKLYSGPDIKEKQKLPKILTADIIVRYYGFSIDDIVQVEGNHGIPSLYVVKQG